MDCQKRNNEGVELITKDERGEDGFRLKRSPSKDAAFKLFDESCSAGCTAACSNKGMALIRGDGTDKQVEAGMKLLEQQCAATPGPACMAAAGVYDIGMLMPPDATKTEKLYRRLCTSATGDLVLVGCHNLARFLDREAAEDEPSAEAGKLYRDTCDKGYARSCNNLAVRLEREGKTADAEVLYKKACSAGETDACKNLENREQGQKDRRNLSGGWPTYSKSVP